MEIGQLEFIIAWVSILGTTLSAVLGAFGFLLREMRRLDAKVDGQSTDIIAVRVSIARIEGHLGIGFPEPTGESPTAGDVPTSSPTARAGAEVA